MARIASAVLATAIPSVRLSITRRYCVKTMAHSMVQFALSDSKMCLVLQKLKNIPQRRPLPRIHFCICTIACMCSIV